MFAIFIIVAPVFALILLGFVAAKSSYLPDNSSRVLAEFGFKVAMPALLFRAMLELKSATVSPVMLWIAYLGSLLCVWLLATLVARVILRRPAVDAPALAMASTFGNTVMLGIPIGLVAFGPEAATPMALMVAADAPLLWIIATLQQELSGRRTGGSVLRSLGGVLWDLIRNPIIMSLLAGAAGRFGGLSLDPLTDRILTMLGQAAIPTALFALGMTLAGFRLRGHSASLVAICIVKMILYPLLVWSIVTYFVDLPPIWEKAVILFAALPVGANAYLFAARYDRAVESISAAIAISTILAALSLTVILALLDGTLALENFNMQGFWQ